MRNIITTLGSLLFVLIFIFSPGTPAQTIFTEDFESGSTDPDWGVFYTGEEQLEAVTMATAPEALPNGGDYIGYIQDIDNSYTGSAVAIRGDFSLSDYSIEGYVYCYVNNSGGSAYTGLVVYADTNAHDFYKLRADFDASDRINFSGLRSDTVTFQPLYNHNFLGSENPGLFPTTDGWHKMKVEVRTLNADSTEFMCYFDDQLLFGCPIYDTTSSRNLSGAYGVYTFQMDGDGIPGYFDNIVVTSLVTSIEDNQQQVLPRTFSLAQNYPNPFNPETQIGYQIAEGGSVTLAVYDILGREIKVLVNMEQPSGNYQISWNGTDSFGNKVPSGIYMYTLKAGNSVLSKKMLLMK